MQKPGIPGAILRAVGGGAPGGKDVEIIECPHCGVEQRREMTSVAYIVTPVYDQRHPKPKVKE